VLAKGPQVDRNGEFSEYAAARWPVLVRSVILLGGSPDEAEDVARAAVERCLLHWDRVRKAADRDAYVHRVLLNTYRSTRRPRWTTERSVPDVAQIGAEAGAAGAMALSDDASAMWKMLGRLSPAHREALVLRFYADLSEQQMATVLGVAAGTVKSRVSRALAALAQDPDLADMREGS
jgi:RNA polymerase sigma-70 factor (sigma-E family)